MVYGKSIVYLKIKDIKLISGHFLNTYSERLIRKQTCMAQMVTRNPKYRARISVRFVFLDKVQWSILTSSGPIPIGGTPSGLWRPEGAIFNCGLTDTDDRRELVCT